MIETKDLTKTFDNFTALDSLNLKIEKGEFFGLLGLNGAGKTTAAYTILPDIWQCQEFVNADEIARGLSPFNPESVAIQAGRLMLERIEILLEQGVSFAIETTLATRSYVQLVRKAQAKGYCVQLLFFWLNSPEVAIQRVARRVAEGGHDIPKEVIKRRYYAGIRNFFDLYKDIVDVLKKFNQVLKKL